jgi:hypothetical protein
MTGTLDLSPRGEAIAAFAALEAAAALYPAAFAVAEKAMPNGLDRVRGRWHCVYPKNFTNIVTRLTEAITAAGKSPGNAVLASAVATAATEAGRHFAH